MGTFALFLLALVATHPSFANAFSFSRDLKLGDLGEDVRALQVILNSNDRTRITDSGAGSPGNETSFFGEKTRSAVIRYQNLYSGEILKPLGIAVGTGYVGAATRNRLNGNTGVVSEDKTNISDAISAFDAALGSSKPETNRSPVDDPRIPKTQAELVAAIDDFAGSDATEEEVKEFSRQMVLARYGYPTDLKRSQDDDDDNGDDDDSAPRPQCSDGINNDPSEDSKIDYPNDSGCTNAQDNTESRSTHRTPGSQDADIDGTGAGCIGLLLDLLGL